MQVIPLTLLSILLIKMSLMFNKFDLNIRYKGHVLHFYHLQWANTVFPSETKFVSHSDEHLFLILQLSSRDLPRKTMYNINQYMWPSSKPASTWVAAITIKIYFPSLCAWSSSLSPDTDNPKSIPYIEWQLSKEGDYR